MVKRLILMVGLPRSGKSTAAQHISRQWDAPIVNPDSIRTALHGTAFYGPAEPMVWAIAKTMVRSLFLAGHDSVIVDACNNTEKRRKEWKSWDNEWELECVVVHENIDVIMERAAGDERLIATIERMMKQHEPVAHTECAEEWYIDWSLDRQEMQLEKREAELELPENVTITCSACGKEFVTAKGGMPTCLHCGHEARGPSRLKDPPE